MRTRALGNTGLDISVVGLGTAAIGADRDADADGIAAIERAVEQGVNWIDTAPVYGGRRAEELLGRALASMPTRPLILGKTSMSAVDGQIVHSLEPKTLRAELEASLQRLGVEALDVLFVHWPIPDAGIEEGWATLSELRQAGKTRFLGASNFDVDQLRRAASVAPVDVVQDGYSLIDTEPEVALLPHCEAEGIGFLAYAPMGFGLFTGAITRARLAAMTDDYRKHLPAFNEPQLAHNLELFTQVQGIAASHGAPPGAVAVAWALANPAVAGAIVGLRNPGWVDEILPAAGELELTGEELSLLGTMAQTHGTGAR